MSSTNILSRPTGPNELLTMFAIAFAAITFCVRMGVPDVLEPATVNAPIDDMTSRSHFSQHKLNVLTKENCSAVQS